VAEMERQPRVIEMPRFLTEELRRVATESGQSVGELMRKELDLFMGRPESVNRWPKDPNFSTRERVRLGFKMRIGDWERLRQAAWSQGRYPSSVARSAALRLVRRWDSARRKEAVNE